MCNNNTNSATDICNALRDNKTCRTPVPDGGINGSGFCEQCWYPSIVDDYEIYQQLRTNGYTRVAAAREAGILPSVENKETIKHGRKQETQTEINWTAATAEDEDTCDTAAE